MVKSHSPSQMNLEGKVQEELATNWVVVAHAFNPSTQEIEAGGSL